MLPQTLVEYLKTAKNQGFSITQIEEALRSQGWDLVTLQKAKEWFETSSTNATTTQVPTAPSLQPLIDKKADEAPNKAHEPFIFTNQSSNSSEKSGKHSVLSTKKILIGFIGVLITLFILSSTSMVLIAYGAVNVGDTQLKRNITNIILSIPFLPKTPEYVLERSAIVQEEAKRLTIDASVALNSPSFTQNLGVGNFDLSIKGPIDFEDPNNPSLSLTIALVKDFNLDVRLKDKRTYFRVNELPKFLTTYTVLLGIPEDTIEKFTKKWFYYDSKALETEARKNLNEKESGFAKEDVERINATLSDERVRKNLSMTRENLDGRSTYKVHLKATSEVINLIEKALKKDSEKDFPSDTPQIKASEYIKNMVIDQWIDAENYNLLKIAVDFTVKTPQTDAFLMPSQGVLNQAPQAASEEIPISLVIKLSNYGKEATIEIPTDAVDFEDFLKTTLEEISSPQTPRLSPRSSL